MSAEKGETLSGTDSSSSVAVVSDAVDPADLARLKSRTSWAGQGDPECAAGRHREPVLAADELPRCAHCGATLSPDALRRAGVKAQKS